ncbi:MAG TPA: cytochrome c-type biogenesis protein [Rhizomicrobium sp.]|jgi:cytochrome c-type biogenesis protein CcmH|nr:cytochrome c-type biogenesis protein [Rhizomicrobium sp.]
MKALFLIFVFAIVGITPAFAQTGPEKLANPVLEARAVALQKELRCLVCQGESLDASNAPLADDLRRLLRARIAAGDSDDQVKAYLVARYGKFILMNPPLDRDTYLLWFGPLAVLLAGASAAYLVMRRAAARSRREAGTTK